MRNNWARGIKGSASKAERQWWLYAIGIFHHNTREKEDVLNNEKSWIIYAGNKVWVWKKLLYGAAPRKLYGRSRFAWDRNSCVTSAWRDSICRHKIEKAADIRKGSSIKTVSLLPHNTIGFLREATMRNLPRRWPVCRPRRSNTSWLRSKPYLATCSICIRSTTILDCLTPIHKDAWNCRPRRRLWKAWWRVTIDYSLYQTCVPIYTRLLVSLSFGRDLNPSDRNSETNSSFVGISFPKFIFYSRRCELGSYRTTTHFVEDLYKFTAENLV